MLIEIQLIEEYVGFLKVLQTLFLNKKNLPLATRFLTPEDGCLYHMTIKYICFFQYGAHF